MDQDEQLAKSELSKALKRILMPLAQLCIRTGVTHAELTELTRVAYVESAQKNFKLPDAQKITASRISVLTGLSRKAVKNVIDQLSSSGNSTAKPLSRAQKVVNAWVHNPIFHDENDKPAVLTIKGPSNEPGTFIDLIKRHSGDDRHHAILEQLNHSRITVQPDANSVELTEYAYIPSNFSEQTMVIGKSVSDLFNTALHNVDCEVDARRFQREVIYSRIDSELAAQCRVLIEEKAQQLLVELDVKLKEAKEQTKVMNQTLDQKNESLIRQGFGMYYIENLTEYKELDED